MVDVRLPSDFKRGHLPGAINLPNGQWHKATGLSREKTNVVYCYSQTCHLGRAICAGVCPSRLPGGGDGRRFRGLEGERLRHRERPSDTGGASALNGMGTQDRGARGRDPGQVCDALLGALPALSQYAREPRGTVPLEEKVRLKYLYLRRALAAIGVTDVFLELFDATHSGIEYRYPLGLKYLAERLSP